MSYVKNTWTEGDVITAEKLNNIENGVSEVGGVYEIELTEEEWGQAESGSGFKKTINEEEYIKLKNNNIIDIYVNLPDNPVHFSLYKEQQYISPDSVIFSKISSVAHPHIAALVLSAGYTTNEEVGYIINQIEYNSQ